MQFGLRRLVALLTVVAICLAIRGYRERQYFSRASAIERLEQRAGMSIGPISNSAGIRCTNFDLGSVPWDESVGRDIQLTQSLRRVSVYRSSFGDEDVGFLLSNSGIEYLNLSRTKITSKGVSLLSKLAALQSLDLSATCLEADAAASLSHLKNLEVLYLLRTQIDDRAVKFLCTMRRLKVLDVSFTGITSEGAKKIACELPNCRVYRVENGSRLFYTADQWTSP